MFKKGLLAVIVGLASAGASAADITIKYADVHPEGHPVIESIQYMDQLLGEWSNGRINVEIYSGGQLGGEKELLEQTQFGAIQMTRVTNGILGALDPRFDVLNLPYFFLSREHMYKVTDSPEIAELLSSIERQGLLGIGYMDAGSRSVYNAKTEINKAEDLKSLKVRVIQNPLFIEMMNAMGGNGMPLSYSELYTSLQTGVVDGAENNPPTYFQHKHYEVAGNYTLTEHLTIPDAFMMSSRFYKSLSDDDREMVMKAAKAAIDKQRKLWVSSEEQALIGLKEAGINVITDFDKTEFIEATAPIRQKSASNYPELLELAERMAM